MAGRGPLPKRTGRQGHRKKKPTPPAETQTSGATLVALPTPAKLNPPTPRRGWLKRTRDRWTRFWDSDVAGLMVGTDLGAFERLYDLYDDRERYQHAIKKGGRLVEGSQGQMVLNPLIREIRALDVEIRNLEDRFGLTPAGRLRLGVDAAGGRNTLDALNKLINQGEETNGDGDDDPRAALLQPGQDG